MSPSVYFDFLFLSFGFQSLRMPNSDEDRLNVCVGDSLSDVYPLDDGFVSIGGDEKRATS